MSNEGSARSLEGVASNYVSAFDEPYHQGDCFSMVPIPNIALGFSQPTEVIPQEKENEANPNPKSKNSNGMITMEPKQGEATPSYDLVEFTRRVVFKDHNEKKILGSVAYYDGRKEMFYVEFDDGDEKYVEKNEIFKMLAGEKEIMEAEAIQPPRSKRTATKKMKRSASGEGSATTTKKKGNTSNKKKM